MYSVVNAPDSRSADNVCATDNAISSVGRICLTMGHMVDVAQIIPIWLNWLPLSEDEDEMTSSIEMLCALITAHPTVFLDGDMGKVSQIIFVLGMYMVADCAQEYLFDQIKTTLGVLRSSVGDPHVIGVVKSLPPHLQLHFTQLLQ